MTSQQKTAVNVVFGAMTFGVEGAEQARVHDLKAAGDILDAFQKHGHNEIDTARAYGNGTSETMLGDLEWQKRGIVMDTKYFPTAGKPVRSMFCVPRLATDRCCRFPQDGTTLFATLQRCSVRTS